MRTYKRNPDSRSYRKYSRDSLNKALDEIRRGERTQLEASVAYNIPRGTLQNKLRLAHENKVGGQFVFTTVEEEAFVNHILTVAAWGFPVTAFDLCIIARDYLNKCGRKIAAFGANNCPSLDWAKSFCRRHTCVSIRTATNIKPTRAAITDVEINRYFDNLEKELDGVLASNILNYDETNLCDDPGKQRCIFKRGIKYAERVMHWSKSSTSIMFCGSATGEMLPPYVIYKAEHLYSTWTEGGPPNARYNRSKNGWFDKATFTDWFLGVVLPFFKNKTGKKAIIGDNLSSHFTEDVLNACRAHDIKFICLPPNSTHLTQPLDVAYYGPLKRQWREILTAYKRAHPKNQTVTKNYFPALLKQLCDQIDNSNLVAGFKKTGITPLDRSQVLQRLPNYTQPCNNTVSETFMEYLSQSRSFRTDKVASKRLRYSVEPGKSVCAASCEPIADVQSLQLSENHLVATKPASADCFSAQHTAIIDLVSIESTRIVGTASQQCAEVMDTCNKINTGSFLLVKFATQNRTSRYYVGKVTAVLDGKSPGTSTSNTIYSGYEISFLRRIKDYFIFPEKPDVSDIAASDVVKVLPTPAVNKRGVITFPCSFEDFTVW